ncbi:protein of unknown function [Agrobacterium pusense]|uniref:Uncharacterized protein n=1 Tax=Agrobacterium pusense TaxID=648995 RepID=U4PVU2_9HYPH|nr:protein of unknown function [Agrobacterium pusense]
MAAGLGHYTLILNDDSKRPVSSRQGECVILVVSGNRLKCLSRFVCAFCARRSKHDIPTG